MKRNSHLLDSPCKKKAVRNANRTSERRRFMTTSRKFPTGVLTSLLAIICALLPMRAAALGARIGTTFLDLPCPPGYADAATLPHGFLTYMSRLMPDNVRIVGSCVKAKEGTRLAQGDFSQMEGFIVYITAREIENRTVDEKFFREFKQGFAQGFEETVRKEMAGAQPWTRMEVKEFGSACDVRVAKCRPLGLLFENERCISLGCVRDMETRTDAGVARTFRWLSSATAILVRGRIIVALTTKASRKEADAEGARRFVIKLVANTLARNESAMPTLTPERGPRVSNESELFEGNPFASPLFTSDWKQHVFAAERTTNSPVLSIKAPSDWKLSTIRTSMGFDMTKLSSPPRRGVIRSCAVGIIQTKAAAEIARELERKPELVSKKNLDKMKYLKLANGELLRFGLTRVDGEKSLWTESRHDVSSFDKSSDFKMLAIMSPWPEKNAVFVLSFCVESESGRSAMERGWKEAAPIFREILKSAARQ